MTPKPISKPDNFVKQEDCEKNTHIPKWIFIVFLTIFFSLMTIFLTLVRYSASEVRAAATSSRDSIREIEKTIKNTESVANQLNVHLRVSEVEKETLIDKLEDIRKEISNLRQDQKILLNKILNLQK